MGAQVLFAVDAAPKDEFLSQVLSQVLLSTVRRRGTRPEQIEF
jgi:hypothetical protein